MEPISLSSLFSNAVPSISLPSMRKVLKQLFISTIIGFLIGHFIREKTSRKFIRCPKRRNIGIIFVLTTAKYIQREKAIRNTWGIAAKSRGFQVAFVRHQTSRKFNDVIEFPNVPDEVYPPQKKSFALLRYAWRHLIHQYDWFVRIDDDAFLNSKELEKFLRKLNSTRVHYIGAPGYGRHSADFVEGNKTYCMGGTSIMKGLTIIRILYFTI